MVTFARKSLVAAAGMAFVAALATSGCATGSGGNWVTLVDGEKGLDNFNRVGEPANWTATEGAIQATSGGKTPSYLVTRQSYKDFQIRAEFWASDDANSGIFMRCQNPAVVNDDSCYEANIFDQRPEQSHATGAIVKTAAVAQPAPKAGGKWNTYDITMRGTHLVVVLNGNKTIDVQDSKYASGPVALQWGRGTIKWRKVQIRSL